MQNAWVFVHLLQMIIWESETGNLEKTKMQYCDKAYLT